MPRESSPSVRVWRPDRERVERAVLDHVRRLRSTHPEIRRVYWFGSWTTGTPHPGSDVDLCVVLTASDKAIRDRIPPFLPSGFPVGIDVFPYTEAELDALEASHPSWYRAITSGRQL